MNIFERVGIEDDQVGELPFLQGPDLIVNPQRARAVDRRRTQDVEVAHPAL